MRYTRAASGIPCDVNKMAPPALLLIAEVPHHLIFLVVSFQWEGGLGVHSNVNPLSGSSCSSFSLSLCWRWHELNWRTDLTKEVIYADVYYSCWWMEGEDPLRVGGVVALAVL